MGSAINSYKHRQFIIIGAGSRGNAYARAVTASTHGKVVAVAEPDKYKREVFGKQFIWYDKQPLPHQAYNSWEAFVERELKLRKCVDNTDGVNIDGAFICTLDETHAAIITALAPLNLHIMCEKPLALSMKDCLSISQELGTQPPKVFSIGHVLRYSPHNIVLRDLALTKQAIGEIVSIEHTEPVGWWHFSHSYVRGNWRRATPEGVGSLLTKSCHDIDFLLWLLCSPSSLTGKEAHLPSSITSSGSLTHFKQSRKPKKAGNATNCLSCAAESQCIYSAKKIYIDRQLNKGNTDWPVKVVAPDIEEIVNTQGKQEAEKELYRRLTEDYSLDTCDEETRARSWYGRCVYESDNNVVDDQIVTMGWDEDVSQPLGRGSKTAIFHMTYPTQAQCDRRGRIYGSCGEISYDSRSISVYTFADQQTTVHQIPKQNPEAEKSHGGGDWGLTAAFVNAVEAVDSGRMSVAEAQREYVGCDLEEVIRSHAVVFAAEEARMEQKVVNFPEWYQSRVQSKEFR